jgi:hypothetical protein
MITVNIVTPKTEYVAKVNVIVDLLGSGFVTLTQDNAVCHVKRATIMQGNSLDDKVQLTKFDPAYQYPLYLNAGSIVELRVLDENGPFYKYYLEVLSNIKIVGRIQKQ